MVSKKSSAIFPVLVIAFALVCSCSTTRVLEDGQYRLAKNSVEVTNDKKFNPKEIEKYIQQKSNSYILFGWNPFLNIYNWSGKNSDGFASNLFRKIGEAPVVYNPSQVEASIENIKRHLEYLGYYNSQVDSDVKVNRRNVDVTYNVTLGKRYKIDEITFSIPEGEFSKDFFADTANLSFKKGDYLSESVLEQETERSAAWMRRNGWFGFTKNYYSFEADTLERRDTANLLMMIKEYTRNQSPDNARPFHKYTFGHVDMTWDRDLVFNRRVLRNMNTIVPGEIYDEEEVNTTYSRLSALKLFNSVNVSLNPRDSLDIVDCNISLTRSRMQGFKVNLEGSTNSNGLVGVSPQLSYFHKNIFHGGQWLNLSFLGNFQFKSSDRRVRSEEFGVSGSISFPKTLGLPNTLFTGPNIPRTEVSASFTYQNRPEYTRNMISTSFGYTGSFSRNRFSYQFFPVQAKIVRLDHLDPAFYNTLAGNPFMRDAYQNHFDLGSSVMLYYTSCPDLIPRVSYQYVRFQLDASGNVLSLFNKSMKRDQYGSRMIWGTPYSQYLRSEVTYGKTAVLGKNGNRAIALRVLGGIGHAYGNSVTMPFEKQFYSGGANSMRGWQARTLGPGRASTDTSFVIPSQTGDVKLEVNLEYRFPLFWKLYGALFTDIGNVWTLKATEDSKDSQFRFDDFQNSMASDIGFGIRMDLNFLILRLDLGMKTYDPSKGENAYYDVSEWLSKDSYAIHFGVGYPF
ncbi:MAG: BamA/TamA family outer membrane protein [Bacteroidales bacterium]|nr:BamA/TamA family outer membrane protein [Bacteroidales bacterium]